MRCASTASRIPPGDLTPCSCTSTKGMRGSWLWAATSSCTTQSWVVHWSGGTASRRVVNPIIASEVRIDFEYLIRQCPAVDGFAMNHFTSEGFHQRNGVLFYPLVPVAVSIPYENPHVPGHRVANILCP